MSNFIFSNLCGSVYSRGPCSAPSASLAAALALTSLPAIAGNVVFTPDGNSLISPVGNRVTVFNLASSTSVTLPFEHVKGARSLCCCAGSLGQQIFMGSLEFSSISVYSVHEHPGNFAM